MLEIERKFLVVPPTSLEGWRERPIEQTYLKSEDGVSRRLRRTCDEGVWHLWRTSKRPISPGVNEEWEEELSEEEWEELWKDRDLGSATVKKVRYIKEEGGLKWELDHFSEPVEMWMLEVEFASVEGLDAEITPPVEVVEEVTGDPRYSNASLARERRVP